MDISRDEIRNVRAALVQSLNLFDRQFDVRSEAEQETSPPAIGAEWQGGIYVGNTLENNERVALVLLPGEFEGKWEDAQAWTLKQNGILPSRIDLLVLWLNARDQFKPEWYWSSEQHHQYSESAWYQDFRHGYQDYGHKTNELRARAVRRVPIR